MIDIHSDKLVPLREVPDFLPRRRGRKVHVSTIYRWAQRGVGGRRLALVRIGGVMYTSLEALAEFASPNDLERSIPAGRAPSRRRLEIESAEREADALGLGCRSARHREIE